MNQNTRRPALPCRACVLPVTVEILEARIAPANLTWVGDVDGNWGTNTGGNTNWSGNQLPQDGDTLTFPFVASNRTNVNNISGLDLAQIVFGGTDYVINGQAITLSAGISDGSTAGANELSIDIGLTSNQTFSVTVASTRLTIDGAISGAFGVTKAGVGTLRFAGTTSNTYTGTTQVNAGTLELQKAGGAGGLTAIEGSLAIGDGAGGQDADIVRLLANNQIDNAIAVSIASSGLLDLNNLSELVGPLSLVSGTDIGAKVNAGTGTLSLSGNITVTQTGTGSGSVSLNGNLNLGNATRTISVGQGVADPDLTITGVVSGAADVGLIKTGPGTLRFAGAAVNTYTGTTTVNEGVLELAHTTSIPGALVIGTGTGTPLAARVAALIDGAFAPTASVLVKTDGGLFTTGSLATIASLTLESGVTNAASVTTGSAAFTVNGPIQLNAVGGGGAPAAITGNLNLGGETRTFTIADGAATADLVIAAIISNGSLTKAGTGTLALGGANTYTGATTVAAGTLRVDGSLDAASAVTVASGGILGGNGPIGSVTVQAGGQVAPGASPGILATGALNFASGAVFAAELNSTTPGTGHDQLAVTGAVALGGSRLVVTPGFSPTIGDQFILVSNDGTDAVTGTFAGLPEGAKFSSTGARFAVSYKGGDGNDIVLTAVAPADISADGRTAIFDDGDGDRVTVKITGTGQLTAGDLVFIGFGGNTLAELRLNRTEFEGANVTITARPTAIGGNGVVNVGFLNAAGIDLGVVKISGDLGRIVSGDGDAVPALKSLATHSLGALGTATQAAGGNLDSSFTGSVGVLKFRSDVRDARIASSGTIAGVNVTGSIVSAQIHAGAALGALTVRGDIVGTAADPVIVSAVGQAVPVAGKPDVAIKSIKVAGGVEFLRILAGYDAALAAVNADASIGKINITGDWRASSVLAGADDAGAKFVGAPTDTERFSQIASIVIKGQVLGTATTSDSFGIFAEQIVAAKIGGAALKLDRGERDAVDAFALSPFPGSGGATSDLFLREATL